MPTVFGQTFCILSRKTALAPAYTRSFVLRCSIQFMRLFVRYHELVDPTCNVVHCINNFNSSNFSKIFKFYFNHQILEWSNPSFLISVILKLSKLIRLLFGYIFQYPLSRKKFHHSISRILILKIYLYKKFFS